MKLPKDALLTEQSIMYQGVGQERAVRITAKFYSSEKEQKVYLTDRQRRINSNRVNQMLCDQ